jgi:lantibiotic modifying enzyme
MKRYREEHCFRCFDPEWLADAFEYYGLKTFNKLMNFIYEYNITDLHTDNIGYIGTRPVILDFSDFLG